MRIEDAVNLIEPGKFRVIGKDNFDEEFFVIDDYESFEEARAIARLLQKDDIEINSENNEIATSFYVYNDKSKIVYAINSFWREADFR